MHCTQKRSRVQLSSSERCSLIHFRKRSPFDTYLEAQQFPSQQWKQKGKEPLWSQGSNHSGRNYGRQLVSHPLWYVLQTPTVGFILKGFAAIWCEFKTLNFTVSQREKQFYNTVHHTWHLNNMQRVYSRPPCFFHKFYYLRQSPPFPPPQLCWWLYIIDERSSLT